MRYRRQYILLHSAIVVKSKWQQNCELLPIQHFVLADNLSRIDPSRMGANQAAARKIPEPQFLKGKHAVKGMSLLPYPHKSSNLTEYRFRQESLINVDQYLLGWLIEESFIRHP